VPFRDRKVNRFVERRILSKLTREDVEDFKTLYPIAPREVLEKWFNLGWGELNKLGCYLAVKRSSRPKPYVKIFYEGLEPLSLDPFNLGFVVGFFEGEGDILVSTSSVPGGAKYSLRVHMYNTDASLIEKVREVIGMGRIYRNSRAGRRTLHILRLGRMEDIYRFLAAVRPHLVSERKRRLTDLALEFMRRRALRKPVDDIHLEMRKLNRRRWKG